MHHLTFRALGSVSWRACAFLILLTGCASWSHPGVSPAPFVINNAPSVVHAFMRNGDTAVVWRPGIRNDSLVGLIPGSAAPGQRLLEFGRPVEDIDSVTVRGFDGSRTLATVGVPLAALSWIFALVVF